MVDLALDKAQEVGYLEPGESVLSPVMVAIMRSASCFGKLFGVIIDKMKQNIKNRIQNLGEGPTEWLVEDILEQLRGAMEQLPPNPAHQAGEQPQQPRPGQMSPRLQQLTVFRTAGPGVSFPCSQTVVEAVSCSLGQCSLRQELTGGPCTALYRTPVCYANHGAHTGQS